MATRRKLWSLLTKKQIRHLHDSGVYTIAAWDRTVEAQRKWDEPDKSGYVSKACWECYDIQQRLRRLS